MAWKNSKLIATHEDVVRVRKWKWNWKLFASTDQPTNQKKKKATTTNHQRMGDDEGTSGAGSARRVREGVSRSYATENKALDALGEEVGFEAVSLDCVVCSLLGLLLAVGNVTCAVLLLLILLRRTG